MRRVLPHEQPRWWAGTVPVWRRDLIFTFFGDKRRMQIVGFVIKFLAFYSAQNWQILAGLGSAGTIKTVVLRNSYHHQTSFKLPNKEIHPRLFRAWAVHYGWGYFLDDHRGSSSHWQQFLLKHAWRLQNLPNDVSAIGLQYKLGFPY